MIPTPSIIKTHAEFSRLTCSICGKEIDVCSFYASYDSERKAHLNCWIAAKAVGHTIPTIKSQYIIIR